MSNQKPISRSQIKMRRWLLVMATAILSVVLIWFFWSLDNDLQRDSHFSGYILLASILFLTAFNIRKRFTFLPRIGTAAQWMQVHIYVGFVTFLIFGTHVAWRVPDGWLEGFLALLYLVVAGSGVYGLLITRVIPKRLTAIGEEVVFERIPALRIQLANDARQTALGSLDVSDVIPRFYVRHLLTFFERPRHLTYFLFPSGRKKRQLVGELIGLQRYLSSDQRKIGNRLKQFVCQKDDLDYHYAMQGRLKLWLFLHIGFTYSLVAISIIHAILVHAFAGGLI